jgi:hypothetical protein
MRCARHAVKCPCGSTKVSDIMHARLPHDWPTLTNILDLSHKNEANARTAARNLCAP